jgi:hypothetical protein
LVSDIATEIPTMGMSATPTRTNSIKIHVFLAVAVKHTEQSVKINSATNQQNLRG